MYKVINGNIDMVKEKFMIPYNKIDCIGDMFKLKKIVFLLNKQVIFSEKMEQRYINDLLYIRNQACRCKIIKEVPIEELNEINRYKVGIKDI